MGHPGVGRVGVARQVQKGLGVTLGGGVLACHVRCLVLPAVAGGEGRVGEDLLDEALVLSGVDGFADDTFCGGDR